MWKDVTWTTTTLGITSLPRRKPWYERLLGAGEGTGCLGGTLALLALLILLASALTL